MALEAHPPERVDRPAAGDRGFERRPYRPPAVRSFGRRLPSFRPPSWPEQPVPGRPPSS
ncbi:MAG: hypothetical protein MUC56_06880 [Thermoanaerobaculales bacterium]|jgi:hypothetical protein|nr:hypothetical protein [Thermoanaerobaculales bacterium]